MKSPSPFPTARVVNTDRRTSRLCLDETVTVLGPHPRIPGAWLVEDSIGAWVVAYLGEIR